MNNTRFNLRALLVLTLCSFALATKAQESTSSPYSRYGPGDLLFSGYAHERGMGGTGLADFSAVRLNGFNPATLAYDTVMILDAGFSGRYEVFAQESKNTLMKSADFNYFSIGLPVWRGKAALSFGILPFASTGYKINDTQVLDTTNTATIRYIGDGGYNKYNVSAGVHLTKELSFGVSANFLYGSIDKIRRVEFSNSNFFSTRYTDITTVSGLYMDFGLHYTKELPDNKRFSIGIDVAPAQKVNATRDRLWENFRTNIYDIDVVRDTISYDAGQAGEITMPVRISTGVAYQPGNRMTYLLDVHYQDWKSYRSFGASDSLSSSFRISAGAQYTPDPKGVNYMERVQYRAGVFFNKTYLDLRNNALSDMGLSIGAGFPFREPKGLASRFNIALEAGQMGTTNDNLIRRRYFRCVIGFTLNEDWFRRRRYD